MNLTDGWFWDNISNVSVPYMAPQGLRADEEHEFSVSLCEPAADLCAEPRFISVRPQNKTWCGAGGELFSGLERRAWFTSGDNIVEFDFKSAMASVTVKVSCSGSWGRCEGAGGLEAQNYNYQVISATGAGAGHIHYSMQLYSKCACNLPAADKIRYHCVKETSQCIMDTAGHHTMQKCIDSCGTGADMFWSV